MRQRTPTVAIMLLLTIVVALLTIGCPPTRDLTRPQVDKVTDLEELMWFLATVADPGFKAASDKEPSAVSDADYVRFADMGRRVPWAAKRLQEKSFSKGADFEAHARALDAAAAQLATATKARDAKAALPSVRAMKKACADCHRQYR